ncbi:MAG: hypothetical protein AUJ92_16725 [Armatimonadetes bacterium CG2_30_59_28]|nr:MAG: hypothetical protein AUJ92_16725 [Armatimonadetes bacterium CG2_30_59_28]PIU64332.1 MAG: hypothetical protein COS85_12870 [Armatimonadetes bacterium CG07_land_8_20_14_0_80_59_28]
MSCNPSCDVIDIGSRLELMVDDFLIEKLKGQASLRLQAPIPREVSLRHDAPWEGNICGYHTIFQDGDIYRMYYRGWHTDAISRDKGHDAVVCYAESPDGVTWTKPNLGLHRFGRCRNTNILWTGVGTHNFVPFKDSNPSCRPNQRFKAVGGTSEEGGLFAFQSADGIHWSLMTETPIITQGAFDSQNLVFWDEVRGEYRAYVREFAEGVRGITTCTSPDFLNWTQPRWLKYPGAANEHLYTNQVLPCPRAPHIFLGFPARFRGDRGDIVEGLFMSSRDGETFHRWGEAFIRPGLNAERWGNRCNYIWWGLVDTDSNLPGAPRELSLYTNESYYSETCAVTRRFTCRMDGFVSLNAPMKGGEMLTKPLIFTGKTLVLNLSTSAAGCVRVGVTDQSGKPFKGFSLDHCPEIFGDDIERVISWKNGSDLSRVAGKPVRLRFDMRDADLYSLRFR